MRAVSASLAGSLHIPFALGLAVLAVLLGALLTKVLLQVRAPRPRRRILRILDVVVWPLLVVFVIVVLVRFRELS